PLRGFQGCSQLPRDVGTYSSSTRQRNGNTPKVVDYSAPLIGGAMICGGGFQAQLLDELRIAKPQEYAGQVGVGSAGVLAEGKHQIIFIWVHLDTAPSQGLPIGP